ncbi:MAG: helix-turn-helix transcriptional regulator [Candidatus Aenigmatarchaeota archaeon]
MIEKRPDETFGDYVKRLRERKGYSQRKLSYLTGISNSTISRIEKGETLNPDLDTLKLLAKYLNVDEIYLIKAAGYPDNSDVQNIENHQTMNKLTPKDEKDIAKDLEKIMNDLEHSEGLMFYNEPLTNEDKELLKQALEFGLRVVKQRNKEKYTPKKYKKK